MKRTLLLLLTAGAVYVTMSSNAGGASISSGAAPAKNGCGGSGCHGTSASTSVVPVVTLTAVSTGQVVTNGEYSPNETYTVAIGGSGGPANKFGYMMSATDGSGKQVGTFSNASSGSKVQSVSGLSVVEHSMALSPTGGALVASVTWKAPAKGSGDITFDLAVNSLNNKSGEDNGDLFNTVSVALKEGWALNVNNVITKANVVVYPNPATDVLHVELPNSASHTYKVLNMNGAVALQGVLQSSSASINVAVLPTGNYILKMTNGADVMHTSFVK